MVVNDVSTLNYQALSDRLCFIKHNTFIIDIISKYKEDILMESFFSINGNQLNSILPVIKHKPFFDKKYIVVVNNAKYSQIKKALRVCKEIHHLILIFIIEESIDIYRLKNDDKMMDELKVIYSNYLGRDYYKSYCYKELQGRITPKALNKLVTNLSHQIGKCGWYLKQLNLICDKENKILLPADIIRVVPDFRLYTVEKYLKSLFDGSKTLPVKTLSFLLDHNKTVDVKNRILYRLKVIEQLHVLKLEGKISRLDFYKDIKKLKDKGDLPKILERTKNLHTYIDVLYMTSHTETIVYRIIFENLGDDVTEYDLYEITLLIQHRHEKGIMKLITDKINKLDLTSRKINLILHNQI